MKNKVVFITLLITLVFLSGKFALGAEALTVWADYACFQDAQQKTYIELYYGIDAQSLVYLKKGNEQFQASVLLNAELYLNGEKIFQDKRILDSPVLADTLPLSRAFQLLHQNRIPIQSGLYTLQVQVTDQQSQATTSLSKELQLNQFTTQDFAFSDVIWVAKIFPLKQIENGTANPYQQFTKNNWVILPFVTNSFYKAQDSLKFYLETYRAGALTQNAYFVETYITEANSQNTKAGYRKLFRPQRPQDFDMISASFDIRNLPSQTYTLHIELKAQDGQVLASTRKKFFIYNEYGTGSIADVTDAYDKFYGYPEKELDEYIATLQYMSTPNELLFAKSLSTFTEKKNYFTHFWAKRPSDPADPQRHWRNYLNGIQYANKKFAAINRKGWKTERGRILLTYGPPSELQDFANEPDKFPYQIWTYNKLNDQSNVIFVFVNQNESSSEFQLLHSTLKGEPYSNTWRTQLLRNRTNTTDRQDALQDNRFNDYIPRTSGTNLVPNR